MVANKCTVLTHPLILQLNGHENRLRQKQQQKQEKQAQFKHQKAAVTPLLSACRSPPPAFPAPSNGARHTASLSLYRTTAARSPPHSTGHVGCCVQHAKCKKWKTAELKLNK